MHKKYFVLSFAITFIVAICILNWSTFRFNVHAQVASPSPSSVPASTPTATPWAHLEFFACLIPGTNQFRWAFHADYIPGEYRMVGLNTGTIINLGYLNVGEEHGGLGPDNTTYILPEDTWRKEWYNPSLNKWQRSGSIPTTSVEVYTQENKICVMPTNAPTLATLSVESTQTPDPTPTLSPASVSETNSLSSTNNNQLAQVTPTNKPTVLGVSSMANTGSFSDAMLLIETGVGFSLLGIGTRRLKD